MSLVLPILNTIQKLKCPPMVLVLCDDRRHQHAGVEEYSHPRRFRCTMPVVSPISRSASSTSRILLTVSCFRVSSPELENTSALPFRTRPDSSLLGVKVTEDPFTEIFNVSPGLIASSSRRSLGSTIRPARSIGTIISFIPLTDTITMHKWQSIHQFPINTQLQLGGNCYRDPQ